MIRPILLLGDSRLHDRCRPVSPDELAGLEPVCEDLRDTLLAFRHEYGAGRGISAPQIGVDARLVYLHRPEPRVLVNPRLDRLSEETFELWDDCMCFPELMVRVRRHRSCRLRWRDLAWARHEDDLADDVAELVQHEVDHLNGILAVERAIGPRAFALRRLLESGPALRPRRDDRP